MSQVLIISRSEIGKEPHSQHPNTPFFEDRTEKRPNVSTQLWKENALFPGDADDDNGEQDAEEDAAADGDEGDLRRAEPLVRRDRLDGVDLQHPVPREQRLDIPRPLRYTPVQNSLKIGT